MNTPDIVIEKNIPLPPTRRKWKTLVSQMKIGDSFPVAGSQHSPGNAIRVTARRLGIKVEVHKVENGIRVWRRKTTPIIP